MIRSNFITRNSTQFIKQQLQLNYSFNSNSNKRLIHLGNLINNYVEEILVKPAVKMPINTNERLKNLRLLMKLENLNFYIIDSGDEHLNEYIRLNDERRQFISGFNGSAGTALISLTEALLFTDGRYHTQAQEQLDNNWKLEKFGNPDVKSWQDHLTTLKDTRIGFDSTLLSISDYNTILPTLHSTSTLIPVKRNLVDEIWLDRPKIKPEPVVLHDIKFSGQSSNSKIESIRNEIKFKSKGGEGKGEKWGVIISQLDEIAWILNLRGNDINFNPVFFSYLIIPLQGHSPTLFINIDQLGDQVYQYLTGLGILIEPYDSIINHLENVGKQLKEGVSKIFRFPRRFYFLIILLFNIGNCYSSI